MSALRWLSALLVALAVVAGVALWLQRQASAQLREEIALLREENASLGRLRGENAQLVAAQVSAAEVERLRADHAAARQLRAEIDQMKTRVDGRERALQLPAEAKAAPVEAAAPAARQWLPAGKLKNAGRATPLAAFETVLWAGTRGDFTVLAPALALDREAANRAREIFEGLSEAARLKYGSPQVMVAALMAKDMPVGDARDVGVKSSASNPVWMEVEAEMKTTNGQTTTVRFEFMRSDGGQWLLKVPVEAVEHLVADRRSGPNGK